MNRVTLYSNGTAVISREYTFQDKKPLPISIPVKKSDLDDVISSLSVFGNVTISEPPTYTTTNALETVLTLNPASVLTDMATKLAGASVEIEAGTLYKGKLMGLHPFPRETNGMVLKENRIVVLTEKGLQQIEEASIKAIRFTEPGIQSEIDKALRTSLTQIKPDSSVVEMTLQPNADATGAIVKYATPVAAWKIRYQLRLSSGAAELEGQAVVDNDTDDDWTETMITTITGDPITFSTDLAEIRRPARRRVNIVADETTGAVMPEAEIRFGGGGGLLIGEPRSPSVKRKIVAAAPGAGAVMERAVQVQAEVRESGDFSVFESPHPVTIRANKSAIIPLFRVAIGEAKAILFYQERDDGQRPFRAVRLKNQGNHSLGLGVCEVFVDGDFQGKCVFEPTKPGEEVLLIHAKETGVRVFKEAGQLETRRMAIQISKGSVYCEEMSRQEAVYRIQNSHSIGFTMEIEHSRMIHRSKMTISTSTGTYESIEIPSGQRIRVTLEAKGNLTVKVMEVQIQEARFVLDDSWLQKNVLHLKAPISSHEGIQKCVTLQKQIDTIESQLAEMNQSAETLNEEQQRLLKLIPNGHSEQTNEWRTDLAIAEKEIREIKKTLIPELKRRLEDARQELRDALSELQFTWKSDKA